MRRVAKLVRARKLAAHVLPALAVALACAGAATPARAYFEETAVGARVLALGFSALADAHDVSAYYWNPAGLARLRGTELLLDLAKPYGISELNEGTIAVGTQRFGTGWALAWHHLGITNAYGEELFSLAAGRPLMTFPGGHGLSGGATFKYGRIGFVPFDDPVDGFPVDYGHQAKGSLDAAITWSTPWRVDVSWVARDLLQPRYQFVEGTGGDRLVTRQQLAGAFRWNRESTVTASWSQVDGGPISFNAGMEVTFYDVFAIRSGLTNLAVIYASTGSPNDFQYTGGFGVYHKGYFIDAAAFTNRDLGASYRMTLRFPVFGGSR